MRALLLMGVLLGAAFCQTPTFAGTYSNSGISCSINDPNSFSTIFRFAHANLNRQMDASTSAVASLVHQANYTRPAGVEHHVVIALDDGGDMTYIGYKVLVTGGDIGMANFLEFIETPSLPLIQNLFRESATAPLNTNIQPSNSIPCGDLKGEFSAYGGSADKLRYPYPGANGNTGSLNIASSGAKPVANCLAYDPTNQVCSTCEQNFYANGGQCLRQFVANCLTYVRNINECQQCAGTYGVINGQCLPQQASCSSVTPQGLCICPLGYTPSRGGCIIAGARDCAVPAFEAENRGLCRVCLAGKLLVPSVDQFLGFCVEPVPFCSRYSHSTLKCEACLSGLVLAPDSTCTAPSTPLIQPPTGCPPMFYQVLYGRTVACEFLNVPFCTEMTVITPGSKPVCTACDRGQRLQISPSGPMCQPTDPNAHCEFYERFVQGVDPGLIANRCKVCALGYFVDGLPQGPNVCTRNTSNCAQVSNGLCALCETGYVPVPGTSFCTVPT